MNKYIKAAIVDIASEPDKEVRLSVAEDPDTSIDDLTILSKDPDWEVREAVAVNMSTPWDVLVELGKDNAYPVRRAARVEYELELGFAGIIGASETFVILAPAGSTEEELKDILFEEYEWDLKDLLSLEDSIYLDDDEWEITLNFNGYIGCEETYTVAGDDEDDAVEHALNEALWDFTIESVTLIPRQ